MEEISIAKHEVALTLSVDWKISCTRRTLCVSEIQADNGEGCESLRLPG